MKFTLYGKAYNLSDIEDLSLKDILVFEQQTKDMGQAVTWAQIGQWGDELEALTDDDAKANHPGTIWLTAVTVWASRRLAGESLTFGEAVDFPMRELRFIDDEPVAVGKAKKSRPTGSGRGERVELVDAESSNGT